MPQGDVIVCLGAGPQPDGRPGPASAARTETCASLYAAGAAPVVLFTGAGRGGVSTAEAMARQTDIPEEAQVIEPMARSTLQNALYARALVAAGDRLILVTEASHLPRSWASFRAMGARDLQLWASGRVAQPAPAALIRESLAIWFNLARYTAWRALLLLGGERDRLVPLLT